MYPIRYTSFPPTKEFALNESEESLFENLRSRLSDQENSRIRLLRMSNGALSVEYSGCPVGKVKLQGRKHSMQILKSLSKSDCIFGNAELFNDKIEMWVNYIRKYLK